MNPNNPMGYRQLDVLDSLAELGPLNYLEVMDDTGQGLSTCRKSLSELFKAGLATKTGHATMDYTIPAIYTITDKGAAVLIAELANGNVPGVSKRDVMKLLGAA